MIMGGPQGKKTSGLKESIQPSWAWRLWVSDALLRAAGQQMTCSPQQTSTWLLEDHVSVWGFSFQVLLMPVALNFIAGQICCNLTWIPKEKGGMNTEGGLWGSPLVGCLE